MALKRGLGRGLNDLLGVAELPSQVKDEKENIESVDVKSIIANPNQPRKFFDEDKLNELAASIKENGIIQPLIVQECDDKYMIIAGERRYRAACLAGIKTLPCIVKNYNDETLIKVSLLENIQREDLNSIEEAETYQNIIERFSITQDALAEQLGKSRTYITNSLRLLKLSDYVKQLVVKGIIMHSVARALITLNETEQNKLADIIVKDGLNARQVEKILAAKKEAEQNGEEVKPKVKKELPIEYLNIEKHLKNFFGSKVKLSHSAKKGKIEIAYSGDEDLERILTLLNISLD